jgi:hypothetical protein
MTDSERKAHFKELARDERRLARAEKNPMVAKVHFQIAACYDEIASSRTGGAMPLRPLARAARPRPDQPDTDISASPAPKLMPPPLKH